MEFSEEQVVLNLVQSAFISAWNNCKNIQKNSQRSAYFVSELAQKVLEHARTDALGAANIKALVQETNINGKKTSGEWLLDIAIVSTSMRVDRTYKNRQSEMIDLILWAIESEFSTNLNEFCRDFSKLIHIKSEKYLYIAGLNQTTPKARQKYIEAQTNFAKSLIINHKIKEPFYIVFVPTPGKSGQHESIWNLKLTDLEGWFQIKDLSPKT